MIICCKASLLSGNQLFSHLKNLPMRTIVRMSIIVFLIISSCNTAPNASSVEIWKQEIKDVEREFAAMADREGIPVAFLYYAAEDVVVMRNDVLIIGRQHLAEHFQGILAQPEDERLSWEPDFVDVSASGDLGYTYGTYMYSYTDSAGIPVEHKGVFHTVWKRQSDGSWRFVWD